MMGLALDSVIYFLLFFLSQLKLQAQGTRSHGSGILLGFWAPKKSGLFLLLLRRCYFMFFIIRAMSAAITFIPWKRIEQCTQ